MWRVIFEVISYTFIYLALVLRACCSNSFGCDCHCDFSFSRDPWTVFVMMFQGSCCIVVKLWYICHFKLVMIEIASIHRNPFSTMIFICLKLKYIVKKEVTHEYGQRSSTTLHISSQFCIVIKTIVVPYSHGYLDKQRQIIYLVYRI